MKKKKIIANAATVATAVGVTVSSTFSSPADLVKGDGSISNPVVIETVMETVDQTMDADEADEDSADEKKKGIRNQIRQQILKIPVMVRAMIGVPLWVLGWSVTSALSVLWASVLSPIAGAVAGWAILALCLLAAGVLAIKAMFPDVPLKKILIKENISLVFLGTILLAISCAVLPIFWEEFDRYEGVIKLGGGLLILVILIFKVKFGPDSYDRAYTIEA